MIRSSAIRVDAQPYLAISLVVLGQPQQHRQGQHKTTVIASQTAATSFTGRQQMSEKQPMVVCLLLSKVVILARART